MSRSYISSPPWCLHGLAGQLYVFIGLLLYFVLLILLSFVSFITFLFVPPYPYRSVSLLLSHSPLIQLASGQTCDKLLCVLLNCAEQWQGNHQYVAWQPGNPPDVTIVLLLADNNCAHEWHTACLFCSEGIRSNLTQTSSVLYEEQ
jgi:hypothetical protein